MDLFGISSLIKKGSEQIGKIGAEDESTYKWTKKSDEQKKEECLKLIWKKVKLMFLKK